MRIPVPVIFSTFGTFTSSDATFRLNLPGTLISTLPLKRPNTSTATSNVPSTPIRSAVTPLLDCCVELVPVGAEPPKPSDARFTPIPIVSTSLPSLNPTSAISIVGPCNVSGPSEMGRVPVAAPGAFGSTVKRVVVPTFARLSFVLKPPKLPVRNCTSTSPALNKPIPFVGVWSFRK